MFDIDNARQVSILVVDDDPFALQGLSMMLRQPGSRVVTVSSGPEALQRIAQERFAVAIIDVRMPGMDGLEVVRRIREQFPDQNLPVLLVTGGSDELSSAQNGYAVGAVDYLSKPVDMMVLRAKVSVMVDLHRRALQHENAVNRARVLAAELQSARQEAAKVLLQAVEALALPLRSVEASLAAAGQEGWDPDLARLCTVRALAVLDAAQTYGRAVAAPVQPGVVDLDELVQAARASLLQDHPDTKAVTWTVEPLGRVHGDRALLGQVVKDVLLVSALNCLDHPTPTVEIGQVPGSASSRVCYVRDNGAPVADPEPLLHPFLANLPAGPAPSGLGLARTLVERMGGKLWIDGLLPRGLSVFFLLPEAT